MKNRLSAKFVLGFALAVILVLPVFVLAATNSTNYQIRDESVGPTHFSTNSASYIINGSLEPMVGNVNSAAYQDQVGSPLHRSASSPQPWGCTPTGTLEISDLGYCSQVYPAVKNLNGTKGADIYIVFVNANADNMHFVDDTHWDKDVSLVLGANVFEAYGLSTCSNSNTGTRTVTLNRVKMADANGDAAVNDYDLSLLSRHWGTASYCLADFNEDGAIDDYDLSLLAGAWEG